MEVIDDMSSAWFGIVPVPCMVQNQLGHLLELHMINVDKKILDGLQKMLYKRNRCDWIIATLAVWFELYCRELDAGRNLYWNRNKDTASVLPQKSNKKLTTTSTGWLLDTPV